MKGRKKTVVGSEALLVKIRPSNRLRLAESRVDLEPLYDSPSTSAREGFGIDSAPQWYLTRLIDGAETPWDQAHARIASQLGIDESDVLFAEPDLIQSVFLEKSEENTGSAEFGVGEDCVATSQDGHHGKAKGEGFAWHLGHRFTELGKARDAVQFANRHTRIAHLDTGYNPSHETTPKNILEPLERNFVEGDGNFTNAADPDNHRWVLDNSGHGTGTLSILAGKGVSEHNE